MSRLKHFLDKDEITFQQLNIGLVEQNSDYDGVVRKVAEKYELSNEIYEVIDRLNQKLGNMYGGKFKFDFCLHEDINIDKLKIKKAKLINRLKEEVFKSRSAFAKSKTIMERKIKER
jgi:hypothetical protein